MYATSVALIIALAAFLMGVQPSPQSIFMLGLAFGALILFLTVYLHASALSPLQRAEQKTTPRLVELFAQDRQSQVILPLLFATPLFLIGASFLKPPYSFLTVIPLIGIALDLLYHYSRRLIDYFNPFRVADFLGNEAKIAIDRDQDVRLCDLIETTSEIASHAIEKQNSALANHSITILEKAGKHFLAASRSLSRPAQNPELEARGAKDTLSYVLLFLLQHLEAIQTKANESKMPLTSGHVITAISKLASYAAETDFSLLLLPLHYIDKCSLSSLHKGYTDVGVKATIGLLELMKTLSQAKGLEYQEIKPHLFKLITTLESIAKELFRQDKSTKIQILIAPFSEIAQTLDQEPFKDHLDTPFLIQQIQRIIGEFEALDAVLKTMPPMPKLNVEEEMEPQKPASPSSPGG
jgi:hypothetical protein